ncbi:Re/Si-specific NAD(P)(+) transhydrogenase subunit alpha [Magnetospirillum fulvum]|jgi:NAD(P) transhydrogenase subunit alpha|uniref:NAD(P) transhydrogenase subunit alpha part 1 n=1 Tax=Magnetospirillum fulvum MGU-K5 TaxID=1316936 RepID=S9TM69_MAGFU|nr:Re/Si-specific NAD(P)(+) transhydrogenase subunit alpha [Magnetospirillum fulvum]EPY03361.1 NAD(P)(+) transhydrogenase [Magnetospirillum fulvum MGU-K5]
MKIAIPKERRAGEARVAASPDTVKKFKGMGFDVVVETGAGAGASILDEHFREAGATIAADAAAALAGADIVLKVQRPEDAEIALIPEGAVLIAGLAALANRDLVKALAARKITAFAMELLPRITRAQSMDILSSQASLAGYKAVLDATEHFGRAIPMMMTAAGTIAPARFLILGAGVAGLQAIATAKRLGGVVYAFDVRPAVKEQVESLGGKFVEVDPDAGKDAETKGGYAKEMDDDYKKKQAAKIAEVLKKTDIAISTALIPGKPAPVLITEEMVKDMREGSVIVDMAVEAGGNCPLSEFDKVVVKHGVTLVGHGNIPARIAVDASALFARNLLNFLTPLVDKDSHSLKFNWDDEILKGTCVTRDGNVVHPALAG